MLLPPQDLKAAACKGMSTAIFFSGHSNREAKRACNHCPVIAACLEAVLEFESEPGCTERHGVWAGLTAEERNKRYGRPHVQEIGMSECS